MSRKGRIYLDYAATTPLKPEIWAEFERVSLKNWANASGMHSESQASRLELEQARRKIATILGAERSNQIIFTSSATEANNLAIKGVVSGFVKNGQKSHVLISCIEHDCVLEAARSLAGEWCEVAEIPVFEEGLVTVEAVKSALRPETKLISVMLVNNEIGTLQPIRKIADMLYEMNILRKKAGESPILLHVDAVQAPLFFSVNINELGCDLLTLSAHKMYGPKGSACLYVADKVDLWPQIVGGGQEHGLRSGTSNVAAAVALAVCLETAQKNVTTSYFETLQKRNYLHSKITELMKMLDLEERFRWNGSLEFRSPANLNFSIKGLDHQTLLTALDLAGISVSGGSSCSSGSEEISHVIRSVNFDQDWLQKMATVRVSIGLDTNIEDLDAFVEILRKVVKDLI